MFEFTKTKLSSKLTLARALDLLTPLPSSFQLIRIGALNDGGYILPDDLADIGYCFSPGCNNSKFFEDSLVDKYSIKSFLCDYSSNESEFKTPLKEGFQFFEKKWLGNYESVTTLSFNKWVEDVSHFEPDMDFILQMDIEGAEYNNIKYIDIKNLIKFRIIVIEIHFLNFLKYEDFCEKYFFPALEKINYYFSCVHGHPNNCCGEIDYGDGLIVPKVLELTFHRKDRIRLGNSKLTLPHVLDKPNLPKREDLCLKGFLTRFIK
jgi:hypothetical protein